MSAVSLIGVRGCGKSNVSRRIAAATKRPLLSTDVLIQYDNGGATIEQIATGPGGWHGFRDLEFAVVAKAVAVGNPIIDCGGGVIVDLDQSHHEVFSERKVSLLREAGTVVWLDGDIEQLAAKAAIPSANRPALSDVTSLLDVMRTRMPHYREAADIRIDIDGKSRVEIAREVCVAIDDLAPFAEHFDT